MKPVPVPDRIAMCAATPHGEYDYWALKPGEEAVSCLDGECECWPVVFVRERVEPDVVALTEAEAILAAKLRAALDQGEGERS